MELMIIPLPFYFICLLSWAYYKVDVSSFLISSKIKLCRNDYWELYTKRAGDDRIVLSILGILLFLVLVYCIISEIRFDASSREGEIVHAK